MMSLLLQPFSKTSPVGIVRRGLHFLAKLSENLRLMISPSFDDRISRLRKLLETHEETSDVVTLALKGLSSYSPHVHVIPKGVWPNEPRNRINVQTHLKSTFADAVNLLKTTGRNVSSTDEQYLRLLLTHSCGWSATYPEHVNDSWVTEFFEIRYPQLKGLVPILDSMTYEEELVHFPDGYHFEYPRFFLLATSNCFYFFDATDGEDGLRIAGETLKEVYEGVRIGGGLMCRMIHGILWTRTLISLQWNTFAPIIARKMGILGSMESSQEMLRFPERHGQDLYRDCATSFWEEQNIDNRKSLYLRWNRLSTVVIMYILFKRFAGSSTEWESRMALLAQCSENWFRIRRQSYGIYISITQFCFGYQNSYDDQNIIVCLGTCLCDRKALRPTHRHYRVGVNPHAR